VCVCVCVCVYLCCGFDDPLTATINNKK